MKAILKKLPGFVNQIKDIQEVIISNILLIGQVPAPTHHEAARIEIFLERLADAQADYCATADFNIPTGIIRGTSDGTRPPIFVVAHMDTFMSAEIDHNYVITKNTITGPGILDNSVSVGVLASLPVICRHLNLKFESDIVLAGVPQSIGKGNLQGIKHLIDTWNGPIRGAVIMEGEELGRLSYYSEGIIRGEIICNVTATNGWEHRYKPNAIIILNKVIDEILTMELPQRPLSRIIIGKINGGFKHGVIAYDARLGFEIQSDSEHMVRRMHSEIKDIVSGIGHEHHVSLKLDIISSLTPANLGFRHPLVKTTVTVMKTLGLHPVTDSSESELSIFLARKIPAITLGITEGKNVHKENASMKITPLFTGISQILGVLKAIDSGVCDE